MDYLFTSHGLSTVTGKVLGIPEVDSDFGTWIGSGSLIPVSSATCRGLTGGKGAGFSTGFGGSFLLIFV